MGDKIIAASTNPRLPFLSGAHLPSPTAGERALYAARSATVSHQISMVITV
jgi:hypothetical protein